MDGQIKWANFTGFPAIGRQKLKDVFRVENVQ
jgi:hypothetical protein